jgi:uncharacterized protein DUF4389
VSETLAPTVAESSHHPIRVAVGDDLERSRLTVFFRLLLAIPHVVVLVLWGVLVVLLALVGWIAALVTGRLPGGLHRFFVSFLRYATRVTGYVGLLSNPFPPFGGGGTYPVDVDVDPPAAQSRWSVLFRIVLAIPALFLAYVFRLGLQVVGFLGWFYCLATGRMSGGLQNLGTYCLRYETQTYGYLLLLTSRYPSLSGIS